MSNMKPQIAEIGTSLTTTSAPSIRSWPRRSVIAGSGTALLACAACGSKSAAAPNSSPGAIASSRPTVAGPSGSNPAIASVSDIPAKSGLVVTAPSGQVILARAGGKVVAHTAVCTHQGAIIDGTGTCPLHGSQFDPSTGAVLAGPANQPLAAVAVKESGGKVYPA